MASEPILIVDDNPANLKVARFALETEGYQVRTAGDAEEALVMLREFRPRLILMDIQLPGMDGLELTRRLKADPATREIVIVAVTAYAMKGDREKALGAGCDGYITKPIDAILLPTQVANHLARSSDVPAVDASRPPALGPPPRGDDSTLAKDERADPRPTILIIDDNPETRRMYCLALETEGLHVIEAHDGASALDVVGRRQERLALIIQDLVLPDMDGLELTGRIRAELGLRHVPIVCVSGFLSRMDEALAVSSGFAQVLVKPVDPFHLIDTVRILLNLQSVPVAEPIGRGRLLIVVDDQPLERKLAQVWFSTAGFNVLVAGDGRQAISLAQQQKPAAIISDVLMPDMDGFTFCLAVRSDPSLAGTPVILTSSAYTEQADIDLARRVGANACVAKTGGFEEVTRALVTALEEASPPGLTESLEAIEREHDRRARSQLEYQIRENRALLRRSTMQQAQLAVLARLSDALRRNVLLDSLLGDALASTLDMAGISKGVLYLSKDDGQYESEYAIGFSDTESLRVQEMFGRPAFFTDVATRSRALSIPSSEVDAAVGQQLLVEAGVTSLLVVPVIAGNRGVGVMLLGARTADVTSEEAKAFGMVLGAQMGQAVGLADAFGRLGASERRYRTLTENASDAICILTRDGVIRQVNRRLTEILGYPEEQFIGRHISDFSPPGLVQENVDRYLSSIANEDKSVQLYEVLKQNGDVALMEFSVAPVEIEGEGLSFAMGRDVTVRRQRARLLALTAAVGLALNKQNSLNDVLQECAAALVTHLGAALARIWIVDETEGLLELRASAGLDLPEDDPNRHVRLGEHKIGRIAKNRKPHLTNRVLGDPEVIDQAWVEREGLVAFAGHPLSLGVEVVGVMAVFSTRPLDEDVITALGSVSDQIAVGIDRHRTAEALRAAEERMRFALQGANVGTWDMNYETGVFQGSEIFERHLGLQPGTFVKTIEGFVECVHPLDREALLKTIADETASGADFSAQYRILKPDGTVGWLAGIGHVTHGEHGQPIRGAGISMDVTERRSLEEQFQQAQKMEAIGQLASGVAHDFNNLLTVILGFSNFVLERLSAGDPRRVDLQQVIKAGEQATTLTRQLLAFSRKQILQPVVMDLNALVDGARHMLGRLIGEQIDLVTVLAPALRAVRVDPGQLEQIVVNLVVNSRDAMPGGGRISIETANAELDGSSVMQHRDVVPGSYVMLAVSDSGTGMSEQVKRHLFEPFFTTKEQGKGTGLGLATVHGIVKQSDGYIWVYSEPGAGTTFKIYLPVADQPHDVPLPAEEWEPAARGTETVLVVEDEEAVRFLSRVILERAGYCVVDAPNPKEAQAVFAENPARFDILVTDIIMPGASGPQLFERLLPLRPGLKVLYVSGYTDDTIVHQGQLLPGVQFLQKPFTAAQLNRRVREVIDR